MDGGSDEQPRRPAPTDGGRSRPHAGMSSTPPAVAENALTTARDKPQSNANRRRDEPVAGNKRDFCARRTVKG